MTVRHWVGRRWAIRRRVRQRFWHVGGER
jgi:hypothetical protein